MWMVYDTQSGDIIFHDTKEEAQNDFDKWISSMEEESGLYGEHEIYIFKVDKKHTIIKYPEE